MSKTLCFNNSREFVTANCADCPIRETDGCRDVDPMNCLRAVGLVMKQNQQGYDVVVGRFIVKPLINQEGGEQ